MRKKSISIYIISLFCLVAFNLNAQENRGPAPDNTRVRDTSVVKEPYYVFPLIKSISVGVNIADPVLRAFGRDYGNYEVAVELNMLNRIFPEVSLGIGSSSKTADDEFKYESKASMFGRIGAGYNFFYKNGSPDFVIVQFRYGFSSSTASITNLIYQDGYWPDTQPKDIEDQKFNSHWIEFGAGLRVNVFKGLNMGWMVYYKPLLKAGTTQYANPWFIPGYGTRGNNFNFSFMVSYEIPLTKKQKTLVDPNAIF